MFNDSINAKGYFRLQVFSNSGALIEDYIEINLVVTLGKSNVARLLAGEGKKIGKIAVGTSGTAPTPSDSSLTGAFSKVIASYTFPEVNSVQFSWSIEETEANGMTIREFGLLLDDGTLFARKTRSDIIKTAGVRLVGTWKIVIN